MPPYTLNDERNQCNEFSPGIVDNDEELLRVLFTEHIGENQKVLPTAISLKDLSDKGLSVYRRKYLDINVVHAQINRHILRQPKASLESGISVFICSVVRGFEDGGQRCFMVIDKALQENVAHASIYSAFEENSPAQLRRLRLMLLPLMQERRSIGHI